MEHLEGSIQIAGSVPSQSASPAAGAHAPTFTPFERDDLERSLIDRFERTAARFPQRIALSGADVRFTYAELVSATHGVARRLIDAGMDRTRPVALLPDSESRGVVALLGVLRAGGFCVSLSPSHPDSGLRSVLTEARVALVVAGRGGLDRARRIAPDRARVLCQDDMPPADAQALPLPAPGDTAVVQFTSGTTGKPKGVVLPHRFIMHLAMVHTNTRRLGPDDRFAMLARCHHVAGVADIFRALLNGAALLPFDVHAESAGRFVTWIESERITILHCVPTLFRAIARMLPPGRRLSDVRIVHLGGEPVTRSDVDLFKRCFAAGCTLTNNLGSSETGPLGQYFVDRQTVIKGDLVPIRLDVEDKEIALVAENGQPVRGSGVGEIVVRSRFISPGYWGGRAGAERDLPRTADGFFRTGDLGRLEPDGTIVHVGRRDSQVKIRGARVDLISVEAAIRNLGLCEDVAVVARPGADGELGLTAFLASADADPLIGARVRAELAARWSSAMVPTEYVALRTLPLTASGKVDRPALLQHADATPQAVPSPAHDMDDIETWLASMWADLLDVRLPNSSDNFFDLGGESLFALRLAVRIEDRWGIGMSMVDILEAPTVAAQAARVRRALEAAGAPE